MKKCIHCGAQIADDSRFCSECGKEITQANVCPHCGASVGEGDAFCQNCGKSLNENPSNEPITYEEEQPKSGFKKYLPYILGIITLIAVCGGWWYYDTSKSPLTTNMVENDSITAEVVSSQNSVTTQLKDLPKDFCFDNVLSLLNNPNNSTYAQQCGLSKLYEETNEKGYYDIVYGYDVNKGEKNTFSFGYKVIFASDHAYYFNYTSSSEENFYFCFKNKEDADYIFSFAKDYGLVEWDNTFFVPSKRASSGIRQTNENLIGNIDYLYYMTAPQEMDGEYFIWFYNNGGQRKIDVRQMEGNSNTTISSDDSYSSSNNQAEVSNVLSECESQIRSIQSEIESLCNTYVQLISRGDADEFKHERMRMTLIRGVGEWQSKANTVFDRCIRKLNSLGETNAANRMQQEKSEFYSAAERIKNQTLQRTGDDYYN